LNWVLQGIYTLYGTGISYFSISLDSHFHSYSSLGGVRGSKGHNNVGDTEDDVGRQNGSDVVRIHTEMLNVRVTPVFDH